MEVIISAAITGGLTFFGVLVTNILSNKKSEANIEKHQAVIQEKIENLTKEVRKHNNFAERIPVIEEKLKVVNHRLDNLEKK